MKACVHHYRVADISLIDRLFSLRDQLGQIHVCRATAAMPRIGEDLVSCSPKKGFHMLLVERTGRLYRTIFESINCSPSATLAALHP